MASMALSSFREFARDLSWGKYDSMCVELARICRFAKRTTVQPAALRRRSTARSS